MEIHCCGSTGDAMEKALESAALFRPRKALLFNFNKLHAVLCITASSAVSISVIIWTVKLFM
jgi:hypothetical protein